MQASRPRSQPGAHVRKSIPAGPLWVRNGRPPGSQDESRATFLNLIRYFDGGRTRARTLDPLIKSQLLYQLSYAPIELTGPGPGKARHVAKAGWAVQPQIPSSLSPQIGCERLTRSPPRSSISLGEIPRRFPGIRGSFARPRGSPRTAKRETGVFLRGVDTKGVSLFLVSCV
jgi:hypothetical protein